MASRRPTHNFITSPSGLLYPEVTDDAVNNRTDITFDIAPSTADGWVLTTEGGVVGWAPPSGGNGGGGVDSIEADGGGQLTGDVTFSEGTNITLTTAGNDIEIAAGGGGGVTEMAYVEFTSGVTINATTEGGANDVVSAGSVAFDGSTRVCIEFFSPQINIGAAAGASIVIVLEDGGTAIGQMARIENAAAVNAGPSALLRRFMTPSNASHTYSISAFRGSADGSIQAGAGGSGTRMPGYIRITSGG